MASSDESNVPGSVPRSEAASSEEQLLRLPRGWDELGWRSQGRSCLRSQFVQRRDTSTIDHARAHDARATRRLESTLAPELERDIEYPIPQDITGVPLVQRQACVV